jgi:hypothetical protein
MRITLVIAIVMSSMLLGCSDPSSTEVASSLDGGWKLRMEPMLGFFGFSLTASGSDVSGDGAFFAEAGRGGTSTVTGSVIGTKVDLDFVLVTELSEGTETSTAHFTGQLDFGSLRGTMQYGIASPDNPPVPIVFLRDDPGQFSSVRT